MQGLFAAQLLVSDSGSNKNEHCWNGASLVPVDGGTRWNVSIAVWLTSLTAKMHRTYKTFCPAARSRKWTEPGMTSWSCTSDSSP